MSKAFTRESDDVAEPALRTTLSALPPGAKNYFTARGVHTLREQLQELSSQPVSPSIRQRIFEIQQSLRSAVVVEPPPMPWEQVLFGATVIVRDQRAETITYHIVGVDEIDLDKNRISWISPVGKALLKKRVGEYVCFPTPGGEQNFEITRLVYENAMQTPDPLKI